MKAACVVLTAGDRPSETARALASVLGQTAEPEVVLVANGCAPPEVPDSVRVLALPDNIGPAAARNRAAEHTTADILFFLDDDTWYPDPEHVARALDVFTTHPDLGVLTFRIDDPSGSAHQRRHVPRLRAGDPERSSEVTTLLEGACAIRRGLFDDLGGYPESFFFGHEGTDLAWRAIDAGWRVRYAGDLAVHHPAAPPTRHAFHHRMTARNRVLLARRLLPWPLVPIYLSTWFVLGVVRARSLGAFRDVLRGFADGMRADPEVRRPISWRTVWRMTRAGRPPII